MTVLVLAGSGEARALLARLEGRDVIASLAGATRAPRALGVATRSGGFGGVAGLRRYLAQAGIRAVVDATHPFATQMTDHAARACAAAGVAHLILQRPGWTAGPGDRWHPVDRLAAVADLIPARATVFLGTGRQSLAELGGLSHCRLLARVIDPPTGGFPFPEGRFVRGRPPFSVAEERAFFLREGIDWLVVKNAGGAASFSKLEAARELGLPVAMLRRRPLPAGAAAVETVAAALQWLAERGL